MKEWKAVGKQHKNPFLLKSIYNRWNRDKQCIHTTPSRAHTYRSFAHCTFDTLFSKKNKWGWGCDGTLSPSRHGGECVCEGSLKQCWLILRERPVLLRMDGMLQVCWRSLRGCTTLTGGIGAQWVIKSLSALPSAGVSASCRHAVSHFQPVMTPVVSSCPPEIKAQSVTQFETKTFCSTGRWWQKQL